MSGRGGQWRGRARARKLRSKRAQGSGNGGKGQRGGTSAGLGNVRKPSQATNQDDNDSSHAIPTIQSLSETKFARYSRHAGRVVGAVDEGDVEHEPAAIQVDDEVRRATHSMQAQHA